MLERTLIFALTLSFVSMASIRCAVADPGGYKIDLPGLGAASISREAGECGNSRGPGAIAGQIVTRSGVSMPHYVSVTPDNAISKTVFGDIHDTFDPAPRPNIQAELAKRTMAYYQKQGELAMKMDEFRGQQKLALVTPDGHFTCRGLVPGAYTVFATIYQKTAPKAPYDKLGMKEMMVIHYFTERVEIPKNNPSATMRADHFTLLGSSPPGM